MDVVGGVGYGFKGVVTRRWNAVRWSAVEEWVEWAGSRMWRMFRIRKRCVSSSVAGLGAKGDAGPVAPTGIYGRHTGNTHVPREQTRTCRSFNRPNVTRLPTTP